MKENLFLTCKDVEYYSPKDEDAFFEWIKKIPSIKKEDGWQDELYLYFDNADISQQDLREIIALFYRYNVDMKQLSVFLNEHNRKWFCENKKAYWHKKVFGS